MKKFKYLLALLLVFTVTPMLVSAEEVIDVNEVEVEQDVIAPTFAIQTGKGTNKLVITNYVEGNTYDVYRATSKTGKYTKIATVDTNEYEDTKVDIGSTYYYKVVQVTEGGSYTSGIVSKKVTLVTPTIKVAASNKTTLVISWNAVEGADGYVVYQATSKNGKYTKIATTKNTSVTKKSLTIGKKYYYKVRAYRKYSKTGYSSYSKIVAGTPSVVAPVVTASGYTYTQNILTWPKVSGATGYKIYRSTSLNGTYKAIKTVKTNSYIDSKLTVGKNYYYKVRAYATVKKKNYFGSYSKVVVSAPKPATPVVNVVNARNSITLNITKVAGATSYSVYKLVGEDYQLLKEITTLSYTDTEVVYGQSYSYKVVAHQNVGANVYNSEERVINTMARPAKLAFTKELLDYNINVVSAAIPEGTDNDDIVITLYRKVGNGNYVELAKVNYKEATVLPDNVSNLEELAQLYNKIVVNGKGAKAFLYVDNGLTLGETYKYKVTVTINGVESEDSNEVGDKIVIAKPEIAGYKTAYNKVMVGASTVVRGADGYEIYRATSKKGKYTKVYEGPTAYATIGSTYNKTYYYKIRAYKVVNGKKIYGEFSDIKALKANVSKLGTFPTKLIGTFGTYTIKSVTMSKKKVANGYVTYTFKVNFKSTYSSINNRGTMTVNFYDYKGNIVDTWKLSANYKRGTHKNYSVTFKNVKIPANAVYYSFA